MASEIKSKKYPGVFYRELANGDRSYFLRIRIGGKVRRFPIGKKSEGITEAFCNQEKIRIINESKFGTDTERMILFEVINARYEQRKPVLAVTNLDGANLAECLGAATLDRLRECGTSVCFDWESMRPKL